MSALIVPRRFKSQPQHAPQLDYQGLAKGVRIIFNPAAGPADLATGRLWTRGGNASHSATQKGAAFSFDAEGDYYGFTGYPEITGNIGTFFIWCPTVGAPDTQGHIVFGASSPMVCAHRIQQNLTIGLGSNGGSSGTLSSWFNTSNRSLVLSSGGTAGTCKSFLDGKDSGQTWANAPNEWGAGDKNFNLGRYVGVTGFQFKGTILVAGYTEAVWGEAEARAFHDDPWQLFKTPARKWWTPRGGKHDLTGAGSTQANNGSAAGIRQEHALAGLKLAQAATSSAGAIAQNQLLEAVSTAQANAYSARAITISLSLAGTPGNQANDTPGTAVITQTQVLEVAATTRGNTFSAAGITQTLVVVATNATQYNLSVAGAIIIVNSGSLIPVSPAQDNAAATGAIIQAHFVVIASPRQGNKSSTGSISDDIVVEAALMTGIRRSIRIKKPGIPAGTPEWLKTMVEILTGRRGNRIEPPKFQAMTFSTPPTRQECETLYEYTNSIRTSLEQVITRLDS
ncbi:MAG: hypothetical protein H0X43_02755 [Nitrosospira sp.]|nr:hypothetical protein [Nitrosospira sp.]